MPLSFAIRASELLERADVSYASGSVKFNQAYSGALYPLVRLADIATKIQYGSSARADATALDGIPMLRMVNVKNDQLDTSSLKYVQLSDNEFDRLKLSRGDLLFNRTNSKELVGKCAIFDKDGDYVFASYLIRVVVDTSVAKPDFIAAFLATPAGRIQIDRVSRQIIGMANINAEELRNLMIPLPPLDVQERLMVPVRSAAQQVGSQRDTASALVNNGGAYLEELLQLSSRDHDLPLSFAVRIGQLMADLRLDAKAYHTPRLEGHGNFRTLSLGDIAEINPKGRLNFGDASGEVPYVGLPDCDGTSVTRVGFRSISHIGSAPLARHGDVLFARIEPSIFNKKYVFVDGPMVDQKFFTSTEFYVLRANRELVVPGFLWSILFTDYVYSQIENQTTGSSGRRRLAVDSLTAVSVPLPPLPQQDRLAKEMLARRESAQRYIEEADALWERTKTDLQAELLDWTS
jgi:type I restriction enzyme, S subunit